MKQRFSKSRKDVSYLHIRWLALSVRVQDADTGRFVRISIDPGGVNITLLILAVRLYKVVCILFHFTVCPPMSRSYTLYTEHNVYNLFDP